MSSHRRGLYETLITRALAEGLESLDPSLQSERTKLRSAEAADRSPKAVDGAAGVG